MSDIQSENRQDAGSWRWNGTIWDFVAVIQWALVYREVGLQKRPDFATIMSSPELVKEEAVKLGITEEAIVREMLRIGKDASGLMGW